VILPTTIIAGIEDDRMRMDVFVSTRLAPEYSRSQVARMIKAGLVLVNGAAARASSGVRAGDRVDVAAAPAGAMFDPSTYKEGDAPKIPVIFADDEIIVVNKPAGMTVHPAPGHPAGTLVDALLARFPELSAMAEPDGVLRPGIVHRLDKDTSGVMVVARTPFSRMELSRQFKDRSVQKTYLAIVKGTVARDRVTIERPVGRHPVERKRRCWYVAGAGEARHWQDASDSRALGVDRASMSRRSFVRWQSGRRWIFQAAGAACAGAFDYASAVGGAA
jgi:23S rRNA pseudouridine1911/1915/1917 synthase